MYSVFLVEDEFVIREGIKQLVDWERHGFELVGEAADGELAWPVIQKKRPDIVITDIKMPFIDGLELSQMIRRELPDTSIIILSGYDDFEYAREAIKIGVNRYLLKPLPKDQFIDVLRQVKKQKDEEEATNRYNSQFSDEVQEYLSSSRRGLFEAITSGKTSTSQILERAGNLGIDLVAEQYNVVLFFLEENIERVQNTFDIAEIQERINKECTTDPHRLLFSIGLEVFIILIKADRTEIDMESHKCTEALKRQFQTLGNKIRWVILVGQPVSRLSGIADCYREARRTFFRKKHMVANQIYWIESVSNEEPLETSHIIDFNLNDLDPGKVDQRIILKFLNNGIQEDVRDFVESYFEDIGRAGMSSTSFCQYMVLSIQFTVNAFLERIGYERPGDFLGGEIKLEEAIASKAAVKAYIIQLLSKAIMLRDKLVKNRHSEMLEKALKYMKENFQDSTMGLNTVAQIVNVSPTYFSSVFSQQTGKTFVESLTELRMEKARELLRCTNETGSEIASKVGYNDSHYFSFLFKKINGCSPRNYRNGKREKIDSKKEEK
ncbi:response regulator [Fusibacter ferrireducens]|uniref:Stage 0 sporulation protein A homolog n=1 Tax=Fusibacter ferrireducens TaxID=2785058 RepID=A0ABR9ZPU8_9FIRM|nr:response regulator [Fusibacter ferrireducens]MBF4692495.1 response regulator [Fusibacter ferrireducens]